MLPGSTMMEDPAVARFVVKRIVEEIDAEPPEDAA
jgi:hypothetical protein